MENFEKKIQEQKDNFKNMEDKIKLIINECNNKTLKRVDETFLPDGVRNANKGEQYILENGLSVYIFYKDNQPINYWISSSPLYEEYEYINQFGTHKNIKYTGQSGIEYTSGGANNGLVYNVTSYYNQIQLGIIGNDSGRLTKLADTVPTMSGGYNLDFSITSSLQPDFFNTNNWKELSSFQESCDLENYIKNFQPKREKSKDTINSLQECLLKVNSLVQIKKQSYEKKGILKKLISKYKSLNDEIEAINAFESRSK